MSAAEGLRLEQRPRARSSGPPTSVEARGRLRILRTALDAGTKALVASSEAVPRDMLRAVRHKTNKGRAAAMMQILRLMPEAPLHTEKRAALWRMFVPDGDAIVVEALAFGAFGTGGWTRRHFGLRFEFHSLARLLDRSGFKVEPLAAMAQAHNALLALTPSEGDAAFALADITLPGGPGVFLATPDPRGLDSDEPRARVKTWLSSEQLRTDDERERMLWGQLVDDEQV